MVLFKTSEAYANTVNARVTTINSANYVDFRCTQLYTPAGEATTHSLLSGLLNDDHLQYHTDARADIWYESKVSPGDLQETSFSGISGASSANVTGLSFPNASVRSFKAHVSVSVDATSDLFEIFEIEGIQRGADWQITVNSSGDDTNVDFNITNTGQITYSSPVYSGFVSMDVRFRAAVTGA